MLLFSFRVPVAAPLVCLAIAAGCNRPNSTEVAQAKADAEAARAEAHAANSELAKSKTDADAARTEATAVKGELLKTKAELARLNASKPSEPLNPPLKGDAPTATTKIADPPPAKPTKKLGQAVLDNDVAQVKAHLYWKTDVNAGEGDDRTIPLGRAAYFAHREVADLLVAHGANVNAVDKHGRTPLHNVFIGIPKQGAIVENPEDRVAVLKLLLAKGADINARDTYAPTPDLKGGDTPLHLAVIFGGTGLIDLLLAKGADVNLKNNNGESPLSLATGAVATKLRSHVKMKDK